MPITITIFILQEAVPLHQETEQLAQLPGDQEDHQRQEAARPLHLQQGQGAQQQQGEEQGVTLQGQDQEQGVAM